MFGHPCRRDTEVAGRAFRLLDHSVDRVNLGPASLRLKLSRPFGTLGRKENDGIVRQGQHLLPQSLFVRDVIKREEETPAPV